jgi:hypothetical protein
VILTKSSLGKSLHYSKKAKGKNILFGFATTGLILVTIIPYISLLNTPYSRFLRQSLFGQDYVKFLWIAAPVLLLPILVIPKKK